MSPHITKCLLQDKIFLEGRTTSIAFCQHQTRNESKRQKIPLSVSSMVKHCKFVAMKINKHCLFYTLVLSNLPQAISRICSEGAGLFDTVHRVMGKRLFILPSLSNACLVFVKIKIYSSVTAKCSKYCHVLQVILKPHQTPKDLRSMIK